MKISFSDNVLKYSKFFINEFLTFSKTKSLSLWAPPTGSGIISSMISRLNKSFEESFIAFAASNIFFGSLQSIVAHPSGDITEYIAFSSIITLLEEARAIAPPEPPSPIIIANVGTFNFMQHSIDFAIASACPRSSAPTPG